LRNRAKIFGTAIKPRLSVFRSNKYVSAQLIDDNSGKTLVSASSRELAKTKKGKKADQSKALGVLIAEKSKKIGIKEVIFSKGPYLYHGRIKALAEGAREAGLKI
jgi:large subunit ribosomal protein L18